LQEAAKANPQQEKNHMPSTIEVVRLWYMANGTAVPQNSYPEASGQTFKKGDLVYLVSGKVTECVAPGSNLLSSGNEIFGVALKDASGTVDTSIQVAEIVPGFCMVLPVTHATAASAITAVTQPGSVFQLENVTGYGYAVPIDDTSTPVVTVRKVHPQYGVGTQYGWVEVEFIFTEMQVGTA
jgi:hypothetical protein